MPAPRETPTPADDFAWRTLDTLHSAILCVDGARRVTYINATGEALFEIGAANILGREFARLFSPLEPSSIVSRLAAEPAALTEREAVMTLASGKSILADYSLYPIGEAPRDDEILIEIRPLERQAQFAQDELNAMQQHATRQLARALAHEINNPLGGIRGAAQLLQRELDDPGLVEYTEVVISEVDRLRALIGGMLAPPGELRRDAVNIHEILEHIGKILLAAEPERVRILREYDPSIPEFEADRDLLIQAFLNIARNAVQAIDDRGDVTFRTHIGRSFTIGKRLHRLVVQVDIIDTGRGIPAEMSETIFLPMITDKPDGSGLGLPIAQEIISRHGGTIQLQSSAAGTTFSTILPLDTP